MLIAAFEASDASRTDQEADLRFVVMPGEGALDRFSTVPAAAWGPSGPALWTCSVRPAGTAFHLLAEWRPDASYYVEAWSDGPLPVPVAPGAPLPAETARFLRRSYRSHAALNLGLPRQGVKAPADRELERRLALTPDRHPLAVAQLLLDNLVPPSTMPRLLPRALYRRLLRSRIHLPDTQPEHGYAALSRNPSGGWWVKLKGRRADGTRSELRTATATDGEALNWAADRLGASLREAGTLSRDCWDFFLGPDADGHRLVVTVDDSTFTGSNARLTQVEVEYTGCHAVAVPPVTEAWRAVDEALATVSGVLDRNGMAHRESAAGKMELFLGR